MRFRAGVGAPHGVSSALGPIAFGSSGQRCSGMESWPWAVWAFNCWRGSSLQPRDS